MIQLFLISMADSQPIHQSRVFCCHRHTTIDTSETAPMPARIVSGKRLKTDPGVGPDDHTRWMHNFGNQSGGGIALDVAVPEPVSLRLLMATDRALLVRRERHAGANAKMAAQPDS